MRRLEVRQLRGVKTLSGDGRPTGFGLSGSALSEAAAAQDHAAARCAESDPRSRTGDSGESKRKTSLTRPTISCAVSRKQLTASAASVIIERKQNYETSMLSGIVRSPDLWSSGHHHTGVVGLRRVDHRDHEESEQTQRLLPRRSACGCCRRLRAICRMSKSWSAMA